MTLVQRHRAALCRTATATGPEAPTLCPPWPVAELIAHLVLRESRPDVAAGQLLPPLAARGDRIRAELAATTPFPELVRRFADGPPGWSPARLPPVQRVADLGEFVIHHEDIRRAQPGWQPAPVDPETEQAVWRQLRGMARLVLRGSPVGAVLVAPGVGRAAVRRPPRDASVGSVVLTGAPVELLLYLSGRTGVATVQASGEEATLRRWHDR